MIVNGKVYSWGNVDFKLPGFEDLQIQSIDYDDEMERELAYGSGHMPAGYGEGNYKPSAKMSLLRDDYNDLLDMCKRCNVALYKLKFPKVIVSYANDGEPAVTDVISNVMLQKSSHSNSQGDKSLKVDVDLFVYGKIVRNGVEPI